MSFEQRHARTQLVERGRERRALYVYNWNISELSAGSGEATESDLFNNFLKDMTSSRSGRISSESEKAAAKPKAVTRSCETIRWGAIRCSASFAIQTPVRHSEIGYRIACPRRCNVKLVP